MSDKTFTADEIRTAVENYKLQVASVEKQLEGLGNQIESLRVTQQMIHGAILAFESLLSVQVETPPPAETQPDRTFDTIKG